jgi:hypothetical protein
MTADLKPSFFVAGGSDGREDGDIELADNLDVETTVNRRYVCCERRSAHELIPCLLQAAQIPTK